MPDALDRYESGAKFILELLEKKSDGIRRKDIRAKWILSGFMDGAFNGVLVRLRKRGYVTKKDPDSYMSPYVITEVGKRYLSGLRA